MRRVLIGSLAVMLCLQAASVRSQDAQLLPGTRTISVNGHGKIKAKSDEVIVTFLLESKASSGDACARLQSEKTGKLVEALKKKLVEKGEVETSQYSLSPTLEYTIAPASIDPLAGPWRVTITIEAIADRPELIGWLVEAGFTAGATRLLQAGIQQVYVHGSGERPGGAGAEKLLDWDDAPYRQADQIYRFLPMVLFEVEAHGPMPGKTVEQALLSAKKVEQALNQKLTNQGSVSFQHLDVSSIAPQGAAAQQFSGSTPTMYVAHTNVDAKSKQLDLLGPLIEAGMRAGALQVVSVGFTVFNDAAARKQAIDAASRDAQMKAETVAKSMGVKLGKVLELTTDVQVEPEIVQGQVLAAALTEAAAAGPSRRVMPVLPRDVAFAADVNVIYQIE